METKLSYHLLTYTLFLSLLTSHPLLILSDSHAFPMDFLQPLIGTRKGASAKGLSTLKQYLSNLGYIKSQQLSNNDSFDDILDTAVKSYQSFFKLPVTGVLDADTVALLRRPRCGVADFTKIPPGTTHPQNASSYYTFFPGSPKWPKRELTYSFPAGTRNDTNRAIAGAASLWGKVANLGFSYIPDYNRADIKISFQVRDHGDGSPFDGPLGILAHAFAPTDGRLHFDGDEVWVDGILGGAFDLQTVGLHELGHILGLGHTPDGGAIMYPYIGSGLRKGLGKDDIDGIKALYH